MQKNYTDDIIEIGIQTIEKLNVLGILPYPKHYNDTFLDILSSKKNIDAKAVIEEHPDLFFFPNPCEKSTNDTIEMARENIKEFETSNKTLRKISNEKGIELSEIGSLHERIDVEAIQHLYSSLISSIESQLDISDTMVKKMRKKIDTFEKNANINPLTKICNHVIFKKSLEKVLEVGNDKELDAFLVIIDADNFINLNDNYGRVAGDKTIIYLARTLQNSLREYTKIYHTSGTEFSIILNRLSLTNARITVDRIVQEIAHSKLFYKGNNIRLTVSVGLTKHQKNDTYKTITKRAKEALKLAKDNGKNCYQEV